MERLRQLYRAFTGTNADTVTKIEGSGSNRSYWRLCRRNGSAIIGTSGKDKAENAAFIYLADHFRNAGLPVPEVYAVDPQGFDYIQEDISGESLFDRLAPCRKNGVYGPEAIALLRATIAELPRIQILGAQGLDFSRCYPAPALTGEAVMFDLNYFKYCFLKTSGVEFNEILLQRDLDTLCTHLATSSSKGAEEECLSGFMYRDFQARNIMLREDKPYFIDFQGGRKGPVLYDLVSFVWQARAAYPADIKEELVNLYLDELQKYLDIILDREKAMANLGKMLLFRTLQVLGAYGFRGRVERKTHFLTSIPAAIDNLDMLLKATHDKPGECGAWLDWSQYPYLYEILQQVVEHEKAGQTPEFEGLTVTVMSFSYKKGIPYDAENGGGYVFDCRYVHNPGRYEQYKHSTGMDEDVIKFLEDDGEMVRYMDNVYAFTDPHIEVFLRRGFTNMMACFGCTGGQHRSVYGAEHLAMHIKERWPQVRVHLIHREQDINKFL